MQGESWGSWLLFDSLSDLAYVTSYLVPGFPSVAGAFCHAN